MRRLRELKRSLKNLWRWFPIICKDRDWDHSYIYTILEFKLRNQSDYISKADRHTMSQKDAKDMLICAELINKVNNDFYNMEYMDYQESEFKFLDIPDKPGFKEVEINMVVDNLDMYFSKYPTWHKRAINYIKENEHRFESDHSDRKLIATIMSDLRQEKAKDLIFKMMSDKINGWWD